MQVEEKSALSGAGGDDRLKQKGKKWAGERRG